MNVTSIRRCRICRCTKTLGCDTPDGPCHWIAEDLCSACAGISIGQELVEERLRQVDAEGWSLAHDDTLEHGELAMAAAALTVFSASSAERRAGYRFMNWKSPLWPAGWEWKPKDKRRDLIRAGALIIAELERLDRQARRTVDQLAGEWGRQASAP